MKPGTTLASLARLPAFYKCRTCAYWHAAGDKNCRPEHNGYTVAVLDAMHPDTKGRYFAGWRPVPAPRTRTRINTPTRRRRR